MTKAMPGPRNLITDVPGILVGNAEDHTVKTGVTVVIADQPLVAAVDVMGGAPGSRETELLAPDKMVETVDALVLSGGSAFGLDAASGVADALARQGRGYAYSTTHIPIVPSAILFDIMNGGDKNWPENPYKALGAAALEAASDDFALGTAGCGTGATSAHLKGGLGSASLVLPSGVTVGVIAGVNPTGSVVHPTTGEFLAGAYEVGSEFGGLGPVSEPFGFDKSVITKVHLSMEAQNTVIAIVATDAALTKAQAKRLAVAAQDGIGRAITPAHTAVDGDLIFATSTGARPLSGDVRETIALGHAAATCLSRAIARAIYEATPAEGDVFPTWKEKFANRA